MTTLEEALVGASRLRNGTSENLNFFPKSHGSTAFSNGLILPWDGTPFLEQRPERQPRSGTGTI